MKSGTYITIQRDGDRKEIDFPANIMDMISEKKKENPDLGLPISTLIPFTVDEVSQGTPGEKAGLKQETELWKQTESQLCICKN